MSISRLNFDIVLTKELDMTDKEKLNILKGCFIDVVWMAIRYAHGRQTYAPSTVRRAVKQFESVFPDWKPKLDNTIKPKTLGKKDSLNFHSDSLLDLFKTRSYNGK